MGRPCFCCGQCTAPIVECYINDGYFYYTITGAENAYLNTPDNIIQLDSEGNASGNIPVSGYGNFALVASNECGISICEQKCYSVFCYSIYKLGEEEFCCSGTNRLNTVTLEIFVNSSLLGDIDYNTAQFYLNSSPVALAFDTRLVKCVSDFNGISDKTLVGLFGRVTINRCDLASMYVLTLDATGECGAPNSEDIFENLFICQNPWYPTFIEKKNTAVIEVDLNANYSIDANNVSYDCRSYGSVPPGTVCLRTYVLDEASGMDAFNGTYLLPIICGGNRPKCQTSIDGQDYKDERKIVLPSTSITCGNILIRRIDQIEYPIGQGFLNSYKKTRTEIVREGYGILDIVSYSDRPGCYLAFRFIPKKTTTYTTDEAHNVLGTPGVSLSESTSICNYTDPPYNTPCPTNISQKLYGTCNTTVVNRLNGTIIQNFNFNSDVCVFPNNSLPNIKVCTLSNGIYTPVNNSINQPIGVLSGTENQEGPYIVEMCYVSDLVDTITDSNGSPTYNPPGLNPPWLSFGQIRSEYECL